ncbi:MAG TPA: hypothetical protein VFK06_24730 [Candidatus Angelobacter sp.]|nr:hypothetical protein [Candidatus Angelobacter sp.]
MATEITLTKETLHEPALTFRQWILTFCAGFIVGATADLLALWLFAHWFKYH